MRPELCTTLFSGLRGLLFSELAPQRDSETPVQSTRYRRVLGCALICISLCARIPFSNSAQRITRPYARALFPPVPLSADPSATTTVTTLTVVRACGLEQCRSCIGFCYVVVHVS